MQTTPPESITDLCLTCMLTVPYKVTYAVDLWLID